MDQGTISVPSRARRYWPLAALLTAALALRVVVVVTLAGSDTGPHTYEHGEIARNLLDGKGFSVRFLGAEGPSSQQAPLYPALLAAVYWLFGVESPTALVAIQLLQCLAGTATVYALVRLAWSLVPESPLFGWIAGVALAVHPAHLYAVTHIQVVVWAALLLTVLLAVAADAVVASRHRAAMAGALAGLMLLVEPIFVLALPFVAVMLWRSHGGSSGPTARRPALAVATMATVCAAVVAPWLVRNRLVHGEAVFVKSTFGYAFWQGNNPASHGTDKLPKASAEALRLAHDGTLADGHRALWEARHETVYIDDAVLGPSGYAELAGLTEVERSRTLGRQAWHWVAAEPGRYAHLCLTRLRYFFLFDETNPKAAHWAYRTTTVVWLCTLAVGMWGWQGWWRALWPLAGIFASVSAFHVLTITSARFRMPLEPFSLIWCAGAVVPPIERIMRSLAARRRPRLSPMTEPDPQDTIVPGPHRRGLQPSEAPRPAQRKAG